MKRVFYIYGTQKNIPRGQHSHYKTKQFLMGVTLDNGKEKETFDLNSRDIGTIVF